MAVPTGVAPAFSALTGRHLHGFDLGTLAGQPGSAPGTTVLETVMMLFHHWPSWACAARREYFCEERRRPGSGNGPRKGGPHGVPHRWGPPCFVVFRPDCQGKRRP